MKISSKTSEYLTAIGWVFIVWGLSIGAIFGPQAKEGSNLDLLVIALLLLGAVMICNKMISKSISDKT